MRIIVAIEGGTQSYWEVAGVIDTVLAKIPDKGAIEVVTWDVEGVENKYIERYIETKGYDYYVVESSMYDNGRDAEYKRNVGMVEYAGYDGVLIVLGEGIDETMEHLVSLARERGMVVYIYEGGGVRKYQ